MLDLMVVPFAAALVILAMNAYFGLHIIRRGVIFVDLAFAQIAALGGTVAFLLGAEPNSITTYAFSFGATLVGALFFSLTRTDDSHVSQEAYIGISYVVASAAVILLASFSAEGAEHIKETLTGSLIWVTWPTVLKIAAAYTLIGLFHYTFRARMHAVTFHPETVARVKLWDFVFYVTFGVAITFAVNLAGVLLIFSTLVIPAVIAFLYTTRFVSALVIAWVSGAIAIAAGIGTSFALDLTTGPLLVVSFGAVLVVAAALRPLIGRRPAAAAGLAVAFSTLATDSTHAQAPAGEHIEIRVGDLVFDARAAGPADGPLVLLLHGFPQTSFSYRHQIATLAEAGFRAVAPDQRGYSPGARPDGVAAYAMTHLVADVVGIADALGARQFHLVGHDWGAAVAWTVATRFPDRVLSLTALSTPHPSALFAARAAPDSEQSRRSAYFAVFSAPGAEQRFLADGAAFLRSLYGDLDPDAVDEYVRALGTPEAMRAALAWYAAAFGPNAPPPPPTPGTPVSVTVPTLYVWSDQDRAFAREPADATRDFVSGPYRFEVMEGVDHWVAERVPHRISALILEHVRSVPAR